MPDDEVTGGVKPTNSGKDPIPVGAAAGGGVPATAGGGGAPAPVGGGAMAPADFVRAGGVTLDVGADVTSDLSAALPAFGNVLLSIGNGVASSQQALDKGVIDTVAELNGTNITVVTEVIEKLNDDGIPDPAKTELVMQDVSVLNYFMPTFHEWKNVSLAMDLTVGSFHQDQGLQFSQTQHSEATQGVGLFWGMIGWFDTESSDSSTIASRSRSTDVRWKQGQVSVDAVLGPRTTGKFPVPASISIGPQIFVTQGAVVEQKTGNVVTGRTVELKIEVRKVGGTANPNQSITLDSAGLLPSFAAGNLTDTNGVVKVTLTRSITPGFGGFRNYKITVSLGQLRKQLTVML